MRGHGAGDKPGRGEHESEDRHRTARGRRRFSFNPGSADRRRRARDQQPIQRQPDHDVQRRPDEARGAPAKLRIEKRRERPSDRARETSDQGDAGDRSARGAAVKPGERGESWIIKAHRHTDTQRSPGKSQGRKPLCDAEQDEPRCEHQIGERQDAAAAVIVDRAADGRTQHG